jgi:hypothetical protein
MQSIYEPTASRADAILGVSSRRIGRAGRLIGSLLLALILHSVPAFGVIVTGQYGAALNWERSSSPEVAGYRVYYGTACGNYTHSVTVGNLTTNTIPGLASGVTYFFAVTAYDTNGLESNFSNESSYVPGIPAVQLRPAPAGQFGLSVSGLIGHMYEIQATQNFTDWTVIGTVTLGASAAADFTDPNAANFLTRFYRTREMP